MFTYISLKTIEYKEIVLSDIQKIDMYHHVRTLSKDIREIKGTSIAICNNTCIIIYCRFGKVILYR